METRALAIAFFYAVGTGLGGIIGPVLFGNLIASGPASHVAFGYLLGGALMFAAGVVEVFLGVDAEQKVSRKLPRRSRPSRTAHRKERSRAARDRRPVKHPVGDRPPGAPGSHPTGVGLRFPRRSVPACHRRRGPPSLRRQCFPVAIPIVATRSSESWRCSAIEPLSSTSSPTARRPVAGGLADSAVRSVPPWSPVSVHPLGRDRYELAENAVPAKERQFPAE